MTHEPPPPRPHLAPPFSRPTHPGSLAPIISPGSPAARPLRPTPYASAVIPAATVAAPRESLSDAQEPATVAGAGGSTGVAPAVPARTGLSLRDLPGGHDHPGGVPANPEPAVEAVDSVFDYPTESVRPAEVAHVTGAASAEWDLLSATSSPEVSAERRPAEHGRSGAEPNMAEPRQASELARGAAETLERLAGAIRRGEVVLPSGVSWPQTAPAVLAAVLTSLLARSAGDDGAAWEASTSEPNL